jgi:hypothetical protein
MPFWDVFINFSIKQQLGSSDRQIVLAFPFSDMRILVRVEELQRVQTNIELIAQRWESLDLRLPFFDDA